MAIGLFAFCSINPNGKFSILLLFCSGLSVLWSCNWDHQNLYVKFSYWRRIFAMVMRQSSMVRQFHQFGDCLWFLFGPTECPCLLISLLLFSLNIHDSVHECPTSHFAANCTISQSLSVASGCQHTVQPNGRSLYFDSAVLRDLESHKEHSFKHDIIGSE